MKRILAFPEIWVKCGLPIPDVAGFLDNLYYEIHIAINDMLFVISVVMLNEIKAGSLLIAR